MIDINLINWALAGLGIGTGVVVLLAAAVIAVAAIVQRRTAAQSHKASKPASTTPRVATPVRGGLALQ